MKKLNFTTLIACSILAITVCFNLYLYYPETQILADPNDNVFQYSLVYRTNWVWENYGCPLSVSCLPNLVDHAVTAWAEGYPLPFYYSHLPQIAIVASYNLVVNPLTAQLLNYPITLYQYYNLTKYLLLCFFPLPIFFALRLVGFSFLTSALGAFFASHFSTDGLYGIDSPSFLWRGYGLTSQLYAMFFLPLGLAFVYRALKDDRKWKIENSGGRSKVEDREKLKNQTSIIYLQKLSSIFYHQSSHTNLILASLFLTLATAGHLGLGIIGILSTVPFLFFDIKPKNIWARFKKLFFVICSLFFVLSYWIIPILLADNYHIISFWDPIWKFNSYGWYEVIRQFFQGEIFDWQRLPITTSLVTIGFFVLVLNSRLFPFSLLFAIWILLYFGRTTWGGLTDLIPGMKDFHQHRFIVGAHVAALFLIPAGIDFILQAFRKIVNSISLVANSKFIPIQSGQNSESLKTLKGSENMLTNSLTIRGVPSGHLGGVPFVRISATSITLFQNIILYIFVIILVSILAYFTVPKTIDYAQLNNRWIGEANSAYLYDEKNFKDLALYLKTLPNARIYAGRPGNWGKDFRLGSTQMYMLFGIHGFDISQFLPETWSMLSENEQNFDERTAQDYDLLNIRYIVADINHDFPQETKMIKKFGPFELYEVPTSGWFDVVTSPMFVKTDKTNFINLVHLWHRSYPRHWKMHPLISVERKPTIPVGMQKIITMVDEVSYQDTPGVARRDTPGVLETKNIFADFPFVFPEATISAYLKESDKDTSGVASSARLPDGTWPVGGDSLDGGETKKKGLLAVISNEKVNKQTYSATIEIPQNCKQCMIMFKMSYHPNWQVKLDGKSAAKLAVFPFYLATPAPPGVHTVEFTHQPNRLKVILLIGEIAVGVLFLIRKKCPSIHP